MKRVLLALALLGAMMGSASAQIGDPNDLTGGVFILHAPAGLYYTGDPFDYCAAFNLADCAGQDNMPETLGEGVVRPVVFFIVSNFYEPKSFNAVEYGLVGTAGWGVVASGECAPGDVLTIPTSAWPGNDEGIAIALQAGDWLGTMVPTSWIAAYFYGEGYCGQLGMRTNPTTGMIGWLSGGVTWSPAATGALGVCEPGVAVCSMPPQPDPEACCFQDGRCELLLEADCVAAGGTYFGGACDPNPCPQPPEPGACCLADGTCLFILEADCPMAGGTWFGGLCDPNPCPQPPEPEACCFADGSCAMLVASECVAAGGTVFAGLTCDPNPCPQPPEPEACCFADGACALLLEADCVAQGGTYFGGVCDPNPCPQPVYEACCFADGTCAMLVADDCVAQGGTVYTGLTCDPNPCPPPVPNDVDSWGEIKSIYK